MLCTVFWLGSRVRQAPTVSPGLARTLWQEEALALSWVGCFAAGVADRLDKGPFEYGYTSDSCAQECHSYIYMALQDGGKCVCGDGYAENPQYQQVEDGECGTVCAGEEGMTPMRYCGSREKNAVYRLQVSSDQHGADLEDLVGTWLFGRERSKCYITRTAEGRLRFGVPLPQHQTALGVLQTKGKWLEAELISEEGELVGTIRLRAVTPQGTLISNFKYPGEAIWGKDTVAHKKVKPPVTTTTVLPIKAPIGRWRVVTRHGLVQSDRIRSSPVIGEKTRGTLVRGWKQGIWIGLVDEPGFMLISNGDHAFLEEVERDLQFTTTVRQSVINGEVVTRRPHEDFPTWKVVTSHGLNVRAEKEVSATILDVKPEGTMVHGIKEGNWVALLEEPGYMMISGLTGKVFLEQASPAGTTTVPQISQVGEAKVWEVVTKHGLNVRSNPSSSSHVVGLKTAGTMVHGRQEGSWLELADEPGYLMISDGDQFFLKVVSTITDAEDVAGEKANRCSCSHGTPTIATGKGATLCENDGDEDCSACDDGYVISEPAGTGTQTCQASSTTTTTATSFTRTSRTTTTIEICHGNCSKKPQQLECLHWAEDGCHKISDKATCLQSLDGRKAITLNGRRVHAQPCVWCGGQKCHPDYPTSHCMPFDENSWRKNSSTWKEGSFVAASCPQPISHSTYCWALMLPTGYEPDLLKAQASQAIGIFGCDNYTVFSNAPIDLGRWNSSGRKVSTHLVSGSLKVEYGGKWNTALNTGVFLRVWKAVADLGHYRHYDWTVKADPDAVFFPARLRDLLRKHPMSTVPVLARRPDSCGHCALPGREHQTCSAHVKWLQSQGKSCEAALNHTAEPVPNECGCICDASSCNEGASYSAMFLINCRWGLHGPVEVLSRDAVAMFVKSYSHCAEIRAKPYGEDKYLDKCLQKLGARRHAEYSLLSESACPARRDIVKANVYCGSPNVAFHPYKSVTAFFDCWGTAVNNGEWPHVEHV